MNQREESVSREKPFPKNKSYDHKESNLFFFVIIKKVRKKQKKKIEKKNLLSKQEARVDLRIQNATTFL